MTDRSRDAHPRLVWNGGTAVAVHDPRGQRVERWWRFYQTSSGREIVRDELKALGVPARAAVVAAMKRHRRSELMPYEEEHLGDELHAVRVFLDGSTYRLLYAYEGTHDQVLLALHCIQKKDRKLPKRARDLARRRLRDWRARGGR